MTGGSGSRTFGRREIFLVVVALVVRLGWASSASTELWMDHVFNDATAVSLSEGRGFTAAAPGEPFSPGIFRMPGYPAFAAGVYSVAGHSVRAVYLVQAVLDTLSCLLLWRLTVRRAGRKAGLGALFLAATYPFTIWSVGQFSPETLLVFLGVLLLTFIDAWAARGDLARVALTGALGAALVWIKPVLLPLPLLLVVAEKLRGRPWRTALYRPALVGAMMVVLFAPWVLRNNRAFGRFVLAGELGVVVWHGTHDFDERRDEMIEAGFDRDAKMGKSRYEVTRKRFSDSEEVLKVDRQYLEEGLERIRARPLHAFLLDPLRRVPRLWVSTSYAGGPGWVGLGAAVVCIGYLLLGAVGLWRLWGRLRDLSAFWVLPVLLTAVHAALHVEARYTLPARPTLLFLGGVALAWIVPGAAGRGRGGGEAVS